MTTTRAMRMAATTVAAAVVFALLAGFAPVQDASAAELTGTFRSRITPNVTRASVQAATAGTLAMSARTTSRTTTVVRKAARTAAAAPTGTTTTASSTSTSVTTTDESAQARSILAGYIARYPILSGTTVSFGDAQGYQAISYYKSGRIVISSTHTASLDRIIGHEIWHVIDWRDNGVIDWGENVPPR